MVDLFSYLKEINLPYTHHEHPAVFTCADANRLIPDLEGAKTKSLFLRDKDGDRAIMVVVPDHKRVDLNELKRVLDCKRLSFGSADRLRECLGVEPGSVSMLALVHDQQRRVELIIDREVWEQPLIQCHPLVNTATLVIPREGVAQFLSSLGIVPRVIELN